MAAARRRDARDRDGHGPAAAGRRTAWLRRPASPLAAHLRGPADRRLGGRAAPAAVAPRARPAPAPADDPLARPLTHAATRGRAPRSASGTETWAALAGAEWLTRARSRCRRRACEAYGACGFRFLMAVAARPARARAARATPRPSTRWCAATWCTAPSRTSSASSRPAGGPASARRGRAPTSAAARRSSTRASPTRAGAGLAGLPVFARQDERALRADLRAFLHEDTAFRRETGAVPHDFERRIDERARAASASSATSTASTAADDGRRLGGRLQDRPGPREDAAPLGGGTRLQLPVYLLAAADASAATAIYWYITARGGLRAGPLRGDRRQRGERFAAHRSRRSAEGVAAGARSRPCPGDFNEHYVGVRQLPPLRLHAHLLARPAATTSRARPPARASGPGRRVAARRGGAA